MTHHLKPRDIVALGFMTFALFVGAGNIIFPPMVGLQAGEHVWTASIGFLITAVGLPVLTVVALAKVGGGLIASARRLVKSPAYCWPPSAIWPWGRCLPRRVPRRYRLRWGLRR
jgi:branched-subunit amino acid permease